LASDKWILFYADKELVSHPFCAKMRTGRFDFKYKHMKYNG